jgi:hypothetical protein
MNTTNTETLVDCRPKDWDKTIPIPVAPVAPIPLATGPQVPILKIVRNVR